MLFLVKNITVSYVQSNPGQSPMQRVPFFSSPLQKCMAVARFRADPKRRKFAVAFGFACRLVRRLSLISFAGGSPGARRLTSRARRRRQAVL